MLINFKEFIQKYWISFLILDFSFGYGWLIMGITR